MLRRGHADVQASSGGSGHCDTPRPVILDAAFTDDRSSAAPHWLRDDRSSHAELWAVGAQEGVAHSSAITHQSQTLLVPSYRRRREEGGK